MLEYSAILFLLLVSLSCYAGFRGKPSTFKKQSNICATAATGDTSASVGRGQGNELSVTELSLCGALATAVGDLVVHPCDTVKITQQASVSSLSFAAATRQVLAKGGPLALYAGILPYIVCDGLSGAVKFTVFEKLDERMKRSHGAHSTRYAASRFLSAALAMLACSIILVPGEVLKMRLQQGTAGAVGIQGLMTVVRQVLAEGQGVRGFYRGYWATLVRDLPYTAIELGMYETLKSVATRARSPSLTADTSSTTPATTSVSGTRATTVSSNLLAAATAGALAAFFTTPLDLVRTRLMTNQHAQYQGVWKMLFGIYQAGGWHALFVGCTARILWLVPFTTVYLGVYDASKRWISTSKERMRRARCNIISN